MTKAKANESNFGLQLYEAIRQRRLLYILTNRFDYAGIQRLKRADRSQTSSLFAGSDYQTLKAMQQLSHEEIADLFEQRETLRNQIAPIGFMI